MASRVSVNDIGELANYCSRLNSLKGELEENATKLSALAEELETKATAMYSSTEQQSNNWQDPQYETLKNQITPCVTAVNTTSKVVSENSLVIKKQMAQVQESIAYIQQLIGKLNDI